MTDTEIRNMVKTTAEKNGGWTRRDRDAMNEGWDPYMYPEDGYLWEGVVNKLESVTDEEADILCEVIADYLNGEF